MNAGRLLNGGLILITGRRHSLDGGLILFTEAPWTAASFYSECWTIVHAGCSLWTASYLGRRPHSHDKILEPKPMLVDFSDGMKLDGEQ